MNYLTPMQNMVVEARESGKSFVAIAKAANLSPVRIRDIYIRAKSEIERHKGGIADLHYGLTTRARHILFDAKLGKKEVAELAAQDRLQRLRNCGRNTQIELCRWAGVDLPESLKEKVPRGWIAAEEILRFSQFISTPMKHVALLLCAPDHSDVAIRGSCTLIGGTEFWLRETGCNSHLKVTHWQPLPGLPVGR